MREFGFSFSKGVTKGLRPYSNPVAGEELLVACYNLEPAENMLKAHERLNPFGLTGPQAHYFAVKDQTDVVWYLAASADLSTFVFAALPDFAAEGFDTVRLSPVTVPYWIQVDAVDAPITQLYIWPIAVSGDLIVTTSPPAVGTGYDALTGLQMRALSGYIHVLGALTTGDIYWRRLGE